MHKLAKIVYGNCAKAVKSCLKSRYLLAAVLLTTALLPALAAIPVSANPGLTVSNAQIVANVTPGQTLTQTMTITIASADPATDIAVQVTGVAQSSDGSYVLLDASKDTGQYSARSFVTVDKSSFHLDPGASQDITTTIQVPQNVGDGGRYAIINIAEKPVAGTGVSIISAVDVPVYLTITGSKITQTGKITGLTASAITSGQPINILTNFQNTGNHHYKVQGQLTVKNAKGKSLAIIPIPLTSSSIIPGMTRQLVTNLNSIGTLAIGTYTMDAKVMMQDGTLLDQSTSTFNITNQYTPPSVTTTSTTAANQQPALGTANLTPDSASTLQNADGSISINFPQGSAVTAVPVSLQSYDITQVPPLPAGIAPASTCFQVTGLTGLLAKNATVKVKYSAADLAAAGGNASKLKLERWDEGNSFSVLKTTVDKGAMILTANSNQMSVWAVVVGTSTSSGISWTIIGIIIAVVIIVSAIVTMLLLSRRKR